MSKTAKRATALFVALVMSIGLCFGLAACGGGGPASDEDQIKALLDERLSVLKNPTEDGLKTFMGDDMSSLDQLKELGIDPIELIQHVFAKFDYTIDKVTVDGDAATATITMQTVDFEYVAKEIQTSLQSDPEFFAKALEVYASGDQSAIVPIILDKAYEIIDSTDKLASKTTDVKFIKKDGQWDFDEDAIKEYVSDLSGGMGLGSLS